MADCQEEEWQIVRRKRDKETSTYQSTWAWGWPWAEGKCRDPQAGTAQETSIKIM